MIWKVWESFFVAGLDAVIIKELRPVCGFSLGSSNLGPDPEAKAVLLWIASKIGGEAKEVFLGEDVTYVRTPRGWRMKSVNLHVGMALIP